MCVCVCVCVCVCACGRGVGASAPAVAAEVSYRTPGAGADVGVHPPLSLSPPPLSISLGNASRSLTCPPTPSFIISYKALKERVALVSMSLMQDLMARGHHCLYVLMSGEASAHCPGHYPLPRPLATAQEQEEMGEVKDEEVGGLSLPFPPQSCTCRSLLASGFSSRATDPCPHPHPGPRALLHPGR